jgi:ribosomal protein S18 acetylase RimI-like enzyme
MGRPNSAPINGASGGIVQTPSAVTIRPATAEDMRALGRLGALLVAVHHEFDSRRFMAATPETERGYGAYLTSQLDRPEVVLLVAEEADAVVGYAYAGLEGTDYMALRGPAGVVYDLVVDPGRRGQGIGRRLLEASLNALVERGAPRVLLSTAERNPAAQKLFASVGFRRTMIEMTWEPPGPS